MRVRVSMQQFEESNLRDKMMGAEDDSVNHNKPSTNLHALTLFHKNEKWITPEYWPEDLLRKRRKSIEAIRRNSRSLMNETTFVCHPATYLLEAARDISIYDAPSSAEVTDQMFEMDESTEFCSLLSPPLSPHNYSAQIQTPTQTGLAELSSSNKKQTYLNTTKSEKHNKVGEKSTQYLAKNHARLDSTNMIFANKRIAQEAQHGTCPQPLNTLTSASNDCVINKRSNCSESLLKEPYIPDCARLTTLKSPVKPLATGLASKHRGKVPVISKETRITNSQTKSKSCISCGITKSPCWRPSWDCDLGKLCNSCGLRYRKNKLYCSNDSCMVVPSKLEANVIKSKCVSSDLRCLQCCHKLSVAK